MTDPAPLIEIAGAALPLLKAWLVLSVLTTGLFCWACHNADPQHEAGMAGLGHPTA
ncbi:hypothetical protein [Roseomonas marmotae]|uniref:Uncharacterized protein n=1 Tax=Roseomonas marmotae TaxID=2768161 RepID=A0ABS3KBZ6_9PROT|nr:hypothetical protein [Roseomonas marmotae]MBO1074994.1 hypothetical protein [Roseomonas marmotae]QTI79969.1 hypothetical protein IAI58_04080 [Roseomonas marmotae]